MSFVGDVFSFLQGAFGSIFSVGSKIVSGVGGILQDTGIASLLTTITTITNNIDTLVTEFSSTIHNIVDPITKSVDSIAGLARDIQDKIIAPIVTPITTTITEIKNLSSNIGKLVDEGLSGILKIPAALADSLTGISKSWDQSTRQLAEAQRKIVTEALVPGFAGLLGPNLQAITEGLIKFSPPAGLSADPLTTVHLGDGVTADRMKDGARTFVKSLENPKDWMEKLASLLFNVIGFAPMFLAQQEAIVEAFADDGKYSAPTKTLAPGDALTLWRKGILDEKDTRTELQRNGLDASKQTALLENEYFLPDIASAVSWYMRGLITLEQLSKVMGSYKVTPDQQQAILAASSTLLTPGLLVEMLARRIIGQKDFDDQLRSQGYSADRILQFIKASIATPDVGITIAAKANEFAAARGWFQDTYGGAPPDDVLSAGRAARRDDAEITAYWSAHFNAMPIQTAVNLFFRGDMNRDEVKIVVTQNNFPPDMTDLFISAYSSLVFPRSVPTLLANGDISEDKALEILRSHGYNQEDAHLLIADALRKSKAVSSTTKTDTTKLTVAQLGAAYKDGVIDRDTYKGLLATHGLVGDDLDITVALTDYDILVVTKKGVSDTILAELKLGVRAFDDAIQALYDAGFSNPEVEKLAVTFQQAQAQTAKLPSLEMFTRFAKKQLIDRDGFLAGVRANGYSAPWDEIIVSDVLGEPNAPGQPA